MIYLALASTSTERDIRIFTATDPFDLRAQVVAAYATGLSVNAGVREPVSIGVFRLTGAGTVTPNANPELATSTVADIANWELLSKTLDEARINTAALVSDAALQFAMQPNVKYRIRGEVFFDTTANGDFKYGFTGPASPALLRGSRVHCVAGGTPAEVAVDVGAVTNVSLAGTGTNGGYVRFDLIFHNGPNQGTFAFQFAQNTATNDTGAIVRAGSWLEWGIA